MALKDDFIARFPEFSEELISAYWNSIESSWPCFFGGNYEIACDKEAILQLLAHLLIINSNPSQSSDIFRTQDSKSVGSVSVSYGATSADKTMLDDFFRSTKYGMMFLMLIRKNKKAVFA